MGDALVMLSPLRKKSALFRPHFLNFEGSEGCPNKLNPFQPVNLKVGGFRFPLHLKKKNQYFGLDTLTYFVNELA